MQVVRSLPATIDWRRFLALTLLGVAGALIGLYYARHEWASDAEAYWQAALRVRSGAELYPAWGAANLAEVYRYAPWFAWAWVPLTFLSKGVVLIGWSLTLAAAAVFVARRMGEAALLIAPALLGAAWIGNVQPLMIVGLVMALGTRWLPVAIAAAASLKAAPLLLALHFLGRREWRELIVTLVLTGTLVAPMLFFDLSHYVIDPARTISVFAASPIAWALVAVVAAVSAVIAAPTRYGWAAAATAGLAALPRLGFYDLGYLAVPLWKR